jgi:hypothetical protein
MQFDAQVTPALVMTQVGVPGQINPALVTKQGASPAGPGSGLGACARADGAASTNALTAIRSTMHLRVFMPLLSSGTPALDPGAHPRLAPDHR